MNSAIWFIVFFNALNNIEIAKKVSLPQVSSSDVYNLYSKKLDNLIVYSAIEYTEKEKLYVVIGTKGKKLYYIKHYKNIMRAKDSTELFVCEKSSASYYKDLKSKILKVPDESELNISCISKKDTVINGKTVQQIHDLNGNSDLQIDVIEYEIGTIKKRLEYRGLDVALTLCPDSKERRLFSEIVSEVKNGLKKENWQKTCCIKE